MDTSIEKILNMVKEGKISPEEAENIIQAINIKKDRSPGSGSKHHLRIKVVETKDSNEKPTNVNINLPINILRLLVKATGKVNIDVAGKNEKVRDTLETYGLEFDEKGHIKDIDAFLEALDELSGSAPLELVNIVDADEETGKNTVVKIYIE
ncbi:MAG: hypothetical protein R6U31_01320 [bacterium]